MKGSNLREISMLFSYSNPISFSSIMPGSPQSPRKRQRNTTAVTESNALILALISFTYQCRMSANNVRCSAECYGRIFYKIREYLPSKGLCLPRLGGKVRVRQRIVTKQ